MESAASVNLMQFFWWIPQIGIWIQLEFWVDNMSFWPVVFREFFQLGNFFNGSSLKYSEEIPESKLEKYVQVN